MSINMVKPTAIQIKVGGFCQPSQEVMDHNYGLPQLRGSFWKKSVRSQPELTKGEQGVDFLEVNPHINIMANANYRFAHILAY